MDVKFKEVKRGVVVLEGKCGLVKVSLSRWVNANAYDVKVYDTYICISDCRALNLLLNKLFSGDRWTEAVVKLASIMSFKTRSEFLKQCLDEVASGAGAAKVERELFKRVWLSIINLRAGRFKGATHQEVVELMRAKASKALSVLREYMDVFEEKEGARKLMEKLEEFDVHLLASELQRSSRKR